jgi:hypothetical protein
MRMPPGYIEGSLSRIAGWPPFSANNGDVPVDIVISSSF